MTPVEPAIFAAELISRLEKLKQQQETMDCLEERLQQITEVGGLTLSAQLPAVQHLFAEDPVGVGGIAMGWQLRQSSSILFWRVTS